MSQSHSSRRRRGRGRGGRGSSQAAEHQASIQDSLIEDSQTFWARSNARLGMDAAYYGNGKNGRGGKPPVDFPCAVCGEWVLLERWAKDRHDVRCDNCKQAVGNLLSGEDKQIANEMRRERKAAAKGKYDGLPEMSEEDIEAVREMRAIADAMGNGRVGNRRGKSGKSNRRRRKGQSGDSRRKGGRRRGRGGGGSSGGGKRSGGRGRGRGGRGRNRRRNRR